MLNLDALVLKAGQVIHDQMKWSFEVSSGNDQGAAEVVAQVLTLGEDEQKQFCHALYLGHSGYNGEKAELCDYQQLFKSAGDFRIQKLLGYVCKAQEEYWASQPE